MVNGEVPTIAGARRLLEFEQAVLAEDEWWDYLLESVGGESRITLLTRESRLPQTMLLALVRNTDQTTRMRAIGLRYPSGEIASDLTGAGRTASRRSLLSQLSS